MTVLLVAALVLAVLSVTVQPYAAIGAWACLFLAAGALPKPWWQK